MNYVDDEWKEKLYLTLNEAEEQGWFTTRLAILMAEGRWGSSEVTSGSIEEMRVHVRDVILRERFKGESYE